MKEYYYVVNDQKKGPLLKSELKGKVLKKTLIWREGMKNWVKASELQELNDLFEPPPIPVTVQKSAAEKSTFDISSIGWHTVLLAVLIIALGVMEYKELEYHKVYSLLFTGLIIATYRLLITIKKYLNDVLNIQAVNKDLNILIVTSLVLGIGFKLFIKYENRLDAALDSNNDIILILIFVLLITLFVNSYYYFKVGKKLSKNTDKMASSISSFCYATAISFAVYCLLAIVVEDLKLAVIVETIVGIIPFLYIMKFHSNLESETALN